MKQPEAKFKTALVDAFLELFPTGFYAYTKALGANGLPDLRFAAPGLGGAWAEAKVADNSLSKLQARCISRMQAAGETAVVVRFDNPLCTDKKAQVFVIARGWSPTGRPDHLASFIGRESLRSAAFWTFLLTGNRL